MGQNDNHQGWKPVFFKAIFTGSLLLLAQGNSVPVGSQTDSAANVPDLVGVWDGGGRVRPVNGPNMPWTPDNFPVLNERALAYQEVFDDCGTRRSRRWFYTGSN